jgi:L-phenylalanine/L-methionine N-acetyltransferase
MVRNITANDFDLIYHLYMHPQINPYLLYEVMDKDTFQPIFNDLLAKDIIYIYEENNETVGMFKLIQLEHRSSHVGYLGGLAIHPDLAGKGYGKKMMEAIIERGRQMNLLRIELSADVINQKAVSLYEKAGFVKEGVLKKYTWLKNENKFLDEVLMAYLY